MPKILEYSQKRAKKQEYLYISSTLAIVVREMITGHANLMAWEKHAPKYGKHDPRNERFKTPHYKWNDSIKKKERWTQFN